MTSDAADKLLAAIDPWKDRLLSLDEATVRHKPSPERWSIAEVIGHLVDSACNNHQRFVRAQECNALTFPAYNQNTWVPAGNYQEFDWASLVQLWYSYNQLIAHVMRNIASSALETECTIAPFEPCTLQFLVEDYVVHLEHHLNKIGERIDG